MIDQYNIIGALIVLQMALSALAFGYMGWRSTVHAKPFSALFGYVCAFFTSGLAGIAGQLVFG